MLFECVPNFLLLLKHCMQDEFPPVLWNFCYSLLVQYLFVQLPTDCMYVNGDIFPKRSSERLQHNTRCLHCFVGEWWFQRCCCYCEDIVYNSLNDLPKYRDISRVNNSYRLAGTILLGFDATEQEKQPDVTFVVQPKLSDMLLLAVYDSQRNVTYSKLKRNKNPEERHS